MTKSTGVREMQKQQRREAIIDAAIRLFRDQGFHGTSLDDIGAVAGVTGPAVYRHFATKDEVLLVALRRGWEARQASMHAADDLPPYDALAAVVHSYCRVAIEVADVIAIYYQEQRYLPDAPGATLRRDARGFIESWTHLLSEVRPELNDSEARAAVHAAVNLIHSVSQHRSGLAPERLALILEHMAMAALMADFDGAAAEPSAETASDGQHR